MDFTKRAILIVTGIFCGLKALTYLIVGFAVAKPLCNPAITRVFFPLALFSLAQALWMGFATHDKKQTTLAWSCVLYLALVICGSSNGVLLVSLSICSGESILAGLFVAFLLEVAFGVYSSIAIYKQVPSQQVYEEAVQHEEEEEL